VPARNGKSSAALSAKGNSIGLSVQLPIFSGFNTTYHDTRRRGAHRVQAARLDKHSPAGGARRLGKLPEPEHRHPDDPHQRRPAGQRRAVRTRVALGRYKAGVGNILDVLNAQSALANARLQRIQAVLDWQVSRAALARADRRPRQPPAARGQAGKKARKP
jgi:outer membrane protein